MNKNPALIQAGRTYGGVSQEARRAGRYQRFLEAGLELFGTTGYHSTTVRTLCSTAGLTDRYFYESFQNIEDLFCATYLYVQQDIRQRIIKSVTASPASPEALARAALSEFFAVMRDERRAHMTLFEVLDVSPVVDEMYVQNTQEFANLIVGLAKAALPILKSSPEDEQILAIGLVGAVVQIAKRWVMNGYNYSDKRVVENCVLLATATVHQTLEKAASE